LVKVGIEIYDLGTAGTLSLDDLGMSGTVMYNLPGGDNCKVFDEVLVGEDVSIGDVCSCSFANQENNSWYFKNELKSTFYQKDVYVFGLVGGELTDPFNGSIVEELSYSSPLNQNTLLFSNSSTASERNTIIAQIRNRSDFQFEFPSVTTQPSAAHADNRWMKSNDRINIVFRDPNPSPVLEKYLVEKYNLSIYHKPSASLPSGANSWTYTYRLKTTDCVCRNAIDVAREIYQQDGNIVKIAEPMLEPVAATASVDTNDPYFSRAWHIKNTGQCLGPLALPDAVAVVDADCDFEEAWDCGYTGEGVRIGVIDKGVYDSDHPDLSSQYIEGYNFIDEDTDVSQSDGTNSFHGQACAGLIAAQPDNGIGTVGVAYGAKIIPTVSYIGSTYEAFQYLCEPALAVDIISCSWGWLGPPSEAIENDIHLCKTLGREGKGIVIVVAAGNENLDLDNPDNDLSFPSELDDVIGVVATTPEDKRKIAGGSWDPSWGSNFGSTLDLGAPGSNLVTTDLLGDAGRNWVFNNCPDEDNLTKDYTYFGGTSAATPIVAGACALLLSANPALTSDEVQQVLENTADKVGGYDYDAVSPGRSAVLGYGRINVERALCTTSLYESALSVSLDVSPNPVSSEARVTFKVDVSSDVNISLVNLAGSKVVDIATDFKAISQRPSEIKFDVSSLAKGVYVVVLKTTMTTISRKIIVK